MGREMTHLWDQVCSFRPVSGLKLCSLRSFSITKDQTSHLWSNSTWAEQPSGGINDLKAKTRGSIQQSTLSGQQRTPQTVSFSMSSRTNPRSAIDTLVNIFLLMGRGLLTVAKFAVYILGEGERVERWKEGNEKKEGKEEMEMRRKEIEMRRQGEREREGGNGNGNEKVGRKGVKEGGNEMKSKADAPSQCKTFFKA
ncbi:hypothetical protein L345_13882, partial [Ophiophagus hannah]